MVDRKQVNADRRSPPPSFRGLLPLAEWWTTFRVLKRENGGFQEHRRSFSALFHSCTEGRNGLEKAISCRAADTSNSLGVI